jgi:hypothetical protein
MGEWFKPAVLKTVEVKASGGSNPSLSAKHERNWRRVHSSASSFFLLCIAPPQAGRECAKRTIPEREGH